MGSALKGLNMAGFLQVINCHINHSKTHSNPLVISDEILSRYDRGPFMSPLHSNEPESRYREDQPGICFKSPSLEIKQG